MKKKGRSFFIVPLFVLSLFLFVLLSTFSSGDSSSIRNSLLDNDLQEDIRATDSVRVSNGETSDMLRLKSYDASERTLTIENEALNILVKLKLLSDYNAHVGVGEDVMIAELLLVDYSYNGNLFESLNFYNIKGNYNILSKVFTLKYATDSFVEECYNVENFDDRNSSLGFENVCENYIKTTWTEFNLLSELPNKNIRVGIFTDTVLGEEVEWVPTIEGFEVMEWASYLTDGLVAYFKLDNSSLTEELSGVNGTNVGSTNVSGKILSARDFELSSSQYINYSDNFDLSGNYATFNAWINPGTLGWSFIASKDDDVNGRAYGFGLNPSGGISLPIGSCGAGSTAGGMTTGNWYMVTAVFNDSADLIKYYVDGVNYANYTTTCSLSDVNANFNLGRREYSGAEDYYDGIIDEVGIWNIILNQTAIDDLYNNGTGFSYPFVVSIAPTIPVLSAPANNSNFAMNSTITFSWNNSTDADGDTITYDLEIYNESDMAAANLVHSNTSIAEGTDPTSINITLSDFTTIDDDYYWRVRANDSSTTSSGWSDTWQFQYASYDITFNLTDSGTGEELDLGNPNDDYALSCNNGFSDPEVDDNPYNATDFGSGVVECTFSSLTVGTQLYFDNTLNVTADSDNKVIEIQMSPVNGLTQEEHDWIEAIYNCVILNVSCSSHF